VLPRSFAVRFEVGDYALERSRRALLEQVPGAQ
jgi:hypothetical protein